MRMSEKYYQQLNNLSSELVTPERFSKVLEVAELATVMSLFPDLPETHRMYNVEQG